MKILALVLGFAFLASTTPAWGGPTFVSGDAPAPHRGVYEVTIKAPPLTADPYLGFQLKATFKRPDGSHVLVDAFYDGAADGQSVFKARAYCDRVGVWSWACEPGPGIERQTGAFTVEPSALPGKLRKHPEDPHQFAYDDDRWFLHIGDTGYRYVVDTEPEWKAYIDQAAKMGATKIRTWFCRSRSNVEALFTADRTAFNLDYWQEIDRRVQYALNRHPHLILQLIPYGEDAGELLRYAQGEPMSRLVAQYAQARFSAFPNVIWCISNDQTIADGAVPATVIDSIGRDMAAREPWRSLLTNHQARYSGYAFTAAPWSDITTLEDRDQIEGKLILEYRSLADDPVVLDEDRYELHETPAHPRYYFRRLMWASLLSGGSATYGGARTYEPYNGRDRGVRGYYDLNKESILSGGADDFAHIHAFFEKTGLTLVNMRPADDMADAAKVIAGDRAVVVYVANPDSSKPGQANAAASTASCQLHLPPGNWTLRWFNPQTGAFFDEPGANKQPLIAPFPGDAVLLAMSP